MGIKSDNLQILSLARHLVSDRIGYQGKRTTNNGEHEMKSKMAYIESLLTKTACEIAYARERPSTFHEMQLSAAVRAYQKANDAYDTELRNATR